MDSLKLPMREIRRKYTKSELICMAWDSKQRAYNMTARTKPHNDGDAPVIHDGRVPIKESKAAYSLPDGINNGVAVPKKFINKEGDIDLRLATGQEALGYIRALGINVVPMIKM